MQEKNNRGSIQKEGGGNNRKLLSLYHSSVKRNLFVSDIEKELYYQKNNYLPFASRFIYHHKYFTIYERILNKNHILIFCIRKARTKR